MKPEKINLFCFLGILSLIKIIQSQIYHNEIGKDKCYIYLKDFWQIEAEANQKKDPKLIYLTIQVNKEPKDIFPSGRPQLLGEVCARYSQEHEEEENNILIQPKNVQLKDIKQEMLFHNSSSTTRTCTLYAGVINCIGWGFLSIIPCYNEDNITIEVREHTEYQPYDKLLNQLVFKPKDIFNVSQTMKIDVINSKNQAIFQVGFTGKFDENQVQQAFDLETKKLLCFDPIKYFYFFNFILLLFINFLV